MKLVSLNTAIWLDRVYRNLVVMFERTLRYM